MAYKYRTTESLDEKTFTVTGIREKYPGKGPVTFNDITIYGLVDGEQFMHTFPTKSRPGKVALDFINSTPFEATLTKRGKYVDFQPLE